MPDTRQNVSPYPKGERIGSAIAHGNALFVGVPLAFFGLMPISFAACPVIAYMIARSFRRRQRAWGAYQGMQAAVIQVLLFLMIFVANLFDGTSNWSLFFWTAWFLFFLYSLWAALDTWMGYDFRYVGIGHLIDHVSRANLARPERRRRWFRGSSDDEHAQRR